MLETEKPTRRTARPFEKEVARLQAESREKDELPEKLRQEPVETCAEEGGDAEQWLTLTRCVHKRRWPPGPRHRSWPKLKRPSCARRPGGRAGKKQKGC